jgi:hypothetical protein
MRAIASDIVGIAPAAVTPRGRVWHALHGYMDRSFTANEIAASFPDLETFVVHRHIAELTDFGAVVRQGRGLFRIAKDPSDWPNPGALNRDDERPSNHAYLRRQLELQVPTTQDGMWGLIQHMHEEGRLISISAMHDAFADQISKVAIALYVGGLARSGYLEPVRRATSEPTWRLVKRQAETPRVTRDGVEAVVPTRQAHIWRAMKMLGYFTVDDIVVSAATEDVALPRQAVASYVEQLAAVGYLMMRGDGDKRVFRLKARMNTGPAAPRILSASFVWDPNTLRIVGEATRVAEVRR